MRIRDSLAAFVLVLGVVGEWVPVAVIDRGPEVRRPQGPREQPGTPTTTTQTAYTAPRPQPLPANEDPIGPPGPQDDVITIRRTVGDSYSNKKGVVVPPAQDHADGSAGPAEVKQQQQQDGDDEMHVEDVAEVREDAADADPPSVQRRPTLGPQDAGDEVDTAPGAGLPLEELREAHRALLKQSTAPVSGKLDFLRRLKNRLLRHIASLVPQTVRTLAGVGSGGGAATAAEGRGHKGIGFPSNEGTLMSLAFLVFAVFLVKVVLQLIYAVQNSQANNAGVRVAQMQIPSPVMPASMGAMMGTMMNMVPAMMPPMMAAMEPAMAMGGRARRAADGDGLHSITANVLEAIDRARDRLAGMGGG